MPLDSMRPITPATHEGESIDYADRKLGTKLNGGILLSANDRSYKRHVEADDTIRDTVFFLLIHLKLLPVKLLNNEQVSVLTAIEKRQRTLLYLLCYDSKVAANIAQLLTIGFANLTF